MNDWKAFITLCKKANPRELEDLFALILTHEEREHIARRLTIIRHLLQDKDTQREIAEKCNLSIVKITRGSNALKIASPQIKDFLRRELCLQK